MKRIYTGLIGLACAAGGLETTRAVTIEELGFGPANTAVIDCTDFGSPIIIEAGVLKLNVGGVLVDGFCIDPFHFSDGSMSGYQAVGLTGAPKGRFMSAATELEIEQLWGRHYSPTMSAHDAAGMQIAIWELVGGSDFKLCSTDDFGAAGFLSEVGNPDYTGPVADLTGLTGPGQDYAVLSDSIQPVPDSGSTLALLGVSVCGLIWVSRTEGRLAWCRV